MEYEERIALEEKQHHADNDAYTDRILSDAEAAGYDTEAEDFWDIYMDDLESRAARDGDFY